MKAKIKSGKELLFCEGASNNWNNLEDKMIINFRDRYTYKSFVQQKNHLYIYTTGKTIDIVFSSEVPILEFDHFCKDQLVLKINKK